MKKGVKILAAIVLLIFIALQLYQPVPNMDKGQVYKTDFMEAHTSIPTDVKAILKTSCYDCHSNHTNYEWYDYIQPTRSFVDNHIKDAKEDLNFNEWTTYSGRKQKRLITSIKKQIETKKMPMSSYTFIHNDAKLSDQQIKLLTDWLAKQE
ncbi:heme-binding domain-containing protein [Chryseobacterium paludis]|uniref:heme-binding domain-containing protein n=1 Tax=Chryseobacterium paludis TaxID=2956784 RepID=UPI0021C1E04E|nr:heme-binding domain-containing protein [Chryseobacterium paludis]